MTGTAGNSLIPWNEAYPPACVKEADGDNTFSGNGIPGAICDDTVKFSRIAWNKIHPTSLDFARAIVTTQYGSTFLNWRKKDITHKPGWNGLFPQGEVLLIEFENFTNTITNITYHMSAFNLNEDGEYVLIKHILAQEPDELSINGEPIKFINQSAAAIPDATSTHATWHWDPDTKELTYIMAANDGCKITIRSFFLSFSTSIL